MAAICTWFWLDEVKTKPKFGKFNDFKLNGGKEKEATFGRFTLNIKSNCAFDKSKELLKKSLYLKLGSFKGGCCKLHCYILLFFPQTRSLESENLLSFVNQSLDSRVHLTNNCFLPP
jgi:hypothetical protein